MEFLNVGLTQIEAEKTIPIQDPHGEFAGRSKPSGGLWFTNYDRVNYPDYNDWTDFILYNRSDVFFFKYRQKFEDSSLPCCLISLNENAKIFVLDSIKKFDYLMQKYPYNNIIFSYKDMTSDYDGIYVDVTSLYGDTMNTVIKLRDKYNFRSIASYCEGISEEDKLILKKMETIDKLSREHAKKTLLLFNTDCIDHYYQGKIKIYCYDSEEYQYNSEDIFNKILMQSEDIFYKVIINYDKPLRVAKTGKILKRINK